MWKSKGAETSWLMNLFILNLVLTWLIFTGVGGTHFRGAVFWWTASADNDPLKVDLSFRISWRRTYRDSTFCNDTTIDSKHLIGPPDAGEIFCTGGCDDFRAPVGDLYYYCTDYSLLENWSSGERTYSISFSKQEFYRIGWKGKGWVEGLQQGRDAPWEFTIYIDLQIRSDTGRLNSSPRTTMTTIISLQHGCNHTLIIPREDPDGDPVFCRWAKESLGECGGICNSHPYLQLNPSRCEITFASTANLGWYALALQLEDYMPGGPNVPMASVPLQFLVQLYESNAECNAMPIFKYPTPEDQTCLLPSVGQLITFQICIQTKDRETSVIDVGTTSTNGMKTSPIRHRPDTSEYYVIVSWTPITRREHIFCFTATDSAGSSTPQRCVFFAVDPVRPKAVSVYISGDKRTILVNFDQKVYLPFIKHYVWVYNALSKTLFFMLDTSSSPQADTVNKTLLINIPPDKTIYDNLYIIMDEGAVRGLARCAESLAVTDEKQLYLYTGTGPRPTTTLSTGKPSMTTPSSSTISPGEVTSDHTGSSNGSSNATTTCCIDVTPVGSTDDAARDYTWLIVLIVAIVLIIAVAVIVAVVIKKGPPTLKKKPHRPPVAAGAGPRVVTAHPPARTNDFSDINVKLS